MGENTKDSATIVVVTEVLRKYARNLKSSVKADCSLGDKKILTPADALFFHL
jgi:hypothetical protein